MNTERFKRFVELTLQKRELESQLKELQSELTPLSLALPDDLISEEMESMRLMGHTLHMVTRHSGTAKDGDFGRLAEALRDHGYGSMLKPHSTSLASMVLEFDNSDEGRPEWLDEVVQLKSTTKLQARKS